MKHLALTAGLILVALAPAHAFQWSSVSMPASVSGGGTSLIAPQWDQLKAGSLIGDYKFGLGSGLVASFSQTPNFGFGSLSSSRFGGFNSFGMTGSSVKFGYDMGAVTPWVGVSQSGFGSSRGFGAFNTRNDPLSPFASGQATSVGAGVDIAITNNLSLSLSASTTTVNRGFGP